MVLGLWPPLLTSTSAVTHNQRLWNSRPMWPVAPRHVSRTTNLQPAHTASPPVDHVEPQPMADESAGTTAAQPHASPNAYQATGRARRP